MPRLKDANAERRRCLLACENCRKRKEKCDTKQPCAGCIKRNAECSYVSIADAKAAKVEPSPPKEQIEEDQSLHEVKTPLGPNNGKSSPRHLQNTDFDLYSPVLPLTNFLGTPAAQGQDIHATNVLQVDGHSELAYTGGLVGVPFLTTLQRVASRVVGDCGFTSNQLRCPFTNGHHSAKHTGGSPNHDFLRVSDEAIVLAKEEVETLVDWYLTSTSGVLNLFETTALISSLQGWIHCPAERQVIDTPLLHLVIAIGAQVAADQGWPETADCYFTRGRTLAISYYTEDPSLQTVQSFMLIAMYMLGESRLEGASMNLDFAIRAAYILGFHRDNRQVRSEAERRSRERTWRSLRFFDLLLSTNLGRQCTTSGFENEPTSAMEGIDTSNIFAVDAQLNFATLGLCSIFDKILENSRGQNEMSIQVANEVSHQHREWTSKLPPLPALFGGAQFLPSQVYCQRVVETAHLICAYHWSIILLTRPFLVLFLSLQGVNEANRWELFSNSAGNATAVLTYAEASIDSALRGLDLAANLITVSAIPKRLPFIANCVYNFALTAGAAFFGDFDRSYALADGMNQAKRFFAHMGSGEPRIRCYAQIIDLLSGATEEYIRRRTRNCMQHRRQLKENLFGTFSVEKTSGSKNSTYPESLNLGYPSFSRFDSAAYLHWYSTACEPGLNPFSNGDTYSTSICQAEISGKQIAGII